MLTFTALTVSGAKNKTLNELVLKVANKDLSALEELYNCTKTDVYGFALSVLKNSTDAEDVLHSTYLSIWKSSYMYVPKSKPMSWIITITKNHCYSVLRNRKWGDESAEGFSAENFTRYFDNKTVIWQHIEKLSDDERKIVFLHAVSDLRYGEICGLVNIPVLKIFLKYNKAVKKLKMYLKQGGGYYENPNTIKVKKIMKDDSKKFTPSIWQQIQRDMEHGRGEIVTVTPTKRKSGILNIISSVAAALVLISAAVFGIANYNRADLRLQATSGYETSKIENIVNVGSDKIDAIISPEDALKKAISHAGLLSKNVVKVKSQFDDTNYQYDVDFYYDGYNYKYEIDAISGKVIKSIKQLAE